MFKLMYQELKVKAFEVTLLMLFMLIANILSIFSKYVNKVTFDQVFYNKNIDYLFDKIIK